MTTHIEFLVSGVTRNQEKVKQQFIDACEWMARNLTEAAARAKDGHYVSETVMSSSLVQDIQRYATEYKVLGGTVSALRELLEEEPQRRPVTERLMDWSEPGAIEIKLEEDRSQTGITINGQPADLTDLAKHASDALRSSPGRWTCSCGRKNRGKALVCDCGVTRESLVKTFAPEAGHMLRFSDGVSIDTGGKLRIITLRDGLYVVGEGMLIPCRDRKDAKETLAAMMKARNRGKDTDDKPEEK